MKQKEFFTDGDKEKRRKRIESGKKDKYGNKQKQQKRMKLPIINEDGDCEYCQGIYCSMCTYADLNSDDN